MKYFKTQATRAAKRYKITPYEFSETTERKFPFEQINEQGRISQYGICPSCLNPIQLIGVVKEIKGNPYGKHTGKNIKGLPAWNQRNIDDNTYIFMDTGIMHTGFIKYQGYMYYCDENGVMVKGDDKYTPINIDGINYIISPSGKVHIG